MPDALDRHILDALAGDARTTVGDLADAVGASPEVVRDRLRVLEADGVVEGYVAQVDYEAAGYGLTVLFRVAVERAALPAVAARLREAPRTVTVYETTGEFELFAVGKYAGSREFVRRFRALLADPDVAAVDVEIARTVVREYGLPPRTDDTG